ncbi:CPBP family intramembrane glutamic endopeptidase [Halopelagius fulvigenes]|uniref:CPBP family intramembrane glutamic endopeptidase n=1 Tax=Halopelagius fulvigenes TaxID=1198324 RepID=A0ABD5U1N5_9EURY
MVGLAVLTFIVALVAGVVFIVPLIILGYDIQNTAVLVGLTAAGQLGMFALGYVYLRYRDLSVPIATPSLSTLGYAIGGMVLALIVATSLSVVLSALDLLPSSVIGDIGATDPTYLLGLAVLSVVIVAPVEEFLFRGIIQRRLRDQFGPVSAVVGASLLFGAMHLANYSGDLVPIVAGAFMISAVGAVFGVVYERTNNLLAPILAHASYNVVLLVVSYFQLLYA